METSFSYADKVAYFSSDERRWINRIRKLKARYPDLVQIIAEPEDNDGCIYCTLPCDWLKVGPKKKYNLSDERKAELAKRLPHA